MAEPDPANQTAVLDSDSLETLLEVLRARGHRLVGPTLRDGAIVYDDIASLADLPEGWTDEQDGGHYRLARRDDDALFGYAVGPQSWKRFLHPPRLTLWRARHAGGRTEIAAEPPPADRFAFIGVRACELRAMAIQDRVLAAGDHPDPHYTATRANAFILAVNCSQAGGTCFCVSMDAGPKAETGFDLSLTEILDGYGRRYLVETGSDAGRAVLAAVPQRRAEDADRRAAASILARTAESMGRRMPQAGLRDLLMANLEHPRWDEVAERCLGCANCTMVCPTCFCTSTEDASDLAGTETSRSRRWDSCFTMDFSYLHGGSVRSSTRARYRQWLTHKLATWHDQFGSSGCVGCGRCITWCPVGIDLTEEVAAIRGGGED